MIRLILKFAILSKLFLLSIVIIYNIFVVFDEPLVLNELSNSNRIQAKSDKELVVGEFQPPNLAIYSQIIERPLFFEDRRIPRPKRQQTPSKKVVVARKPPPQIPIESLVLNGLHVTQDHQRALITGSDGTVAWRHVGDKVDGWLITSIDGAAVHLEGHGNKGLLRLYKEHEGN